MRLRSALSGFIWKMIVMAQARSVCVSYLYKSDRKQSETLIRVRLRI